MSHNLLQLSTFRTAANASRVVFLKKEDQLPELQVQLTTCDLPFLILGEGSNVLFVGDYAGTIIVNQLHGIRTERETDEYVYITAKAGENWHNFVQHTSQLGYYGLENLALIPGSVGAAPVQNIGAYGVEVAEYIDTVTVFDWQTGQSQTLNNAACRFGYRNSHFKTAEWRIRYIITAVTFRLSKHFNPVLSYRGLTEGENPPKTSQQLIERVIAVRQSKLPNPATLPNAGSFFKNPIVTRQQLQQLQSQHPNITYFELDHTQVKIPAAWLLQNAGFKGHKEASGAGVYDQHALILVNHGNATGKDILQLAHKMIDAVNQQFSIQLTPEVRIIESTEEPAC